MVKKFISTLLFTCLICMASLAQADTTRKVYSFKANAAYDRHRISLGNMQHAIYEAADEEDWSVRMLGKQKVELSKYDDGKFAKLIIDYTAQNFKIRLIESNGFLFNSGFTNWMNELVENIQEDLRESEADDVGIN